MGWIDLFLPDDRLSSVQCLSPEELLRQGIRAVVFDIDNTLVPYDVAEPDEALRDFLLSFEQAGLSVALVSNNSPERVETFNRDLGFFALADAHKPSRRALQAVQDRFSPLEKDEILLVGDQLLTDVLTARRCGIRAVTVTPIKARENLFFRFKRALEAPLIRIYEKRKREGN